MTHKFNRAVLLLAALMATSSILSCEDDNKEEPEQNDDLYFVTSNNIAHNYFKPKKANIFTYHGCIIGDWYSNEKAPYENRYRDVYNGYLDRVDTDDFAEEYAKHYFFLDEKGIKKYTSANRKNNRVIIDKNDLISPYKEYADYYGDTTHLKDHKGVFMGISSIENVCVLPLTAIDVTCNKEFDNNHPAGSSLNDIIYYKQSLELYEYLKNKKYQGEEFDSPICSIQDFNPRKLNTLPDNPVYLMESKISLTFDHKPSASGTYEFTVKFTFGADPLTGETVEIAPATVSIDF